MSKKPYVVFSLDDLAEHLSKMAYSRKTWAGKKAYAVMPNYSPYEFRKRVLLEAAARIRQTEMIGGG